MAQKFYTEEYIQDIADAIREKNKRADTYKVSEMAAAVRNTLTGGLNGDEVIVISTTYTTEE